MKITKQMIARARELDACKPALDWLEAGDRTMAELESEFPAWALWAAGKGFDGIDVDSCAERVPWVALVYASELLTPARLDFCAERYPSVALRYAPALLTPARLEWCRSQV